MTPYRLLWVLAALAPIAFAMHVVVMTHRSLVGMTIAGALTAVIGAVAVAAPSLRSARRPGSIALALGALVAGFGAYSLIVLGRPVAWHLW